MNKFIPTSAPVALCALVALLVLANRDCLGQDAAHGEAVYKAQCAVCHGPGGQGTTDKYNEPLAGDLSVTELAKVIDETMPEGAPEKCSTEDSAAVAAYIHQAFYSEVARERLRPARIELARLTVPQYQNAIADLIGDANSTEYIWNSQPGLRGEYYDDQHFKREKRLIERIDSQINFDFGGGRPDDENFRDNKNLSIRWEGSLLAKETGNYDFCVDTENAVRLFINDDRRPLVDAWVRSGTDRLFKASLFLVGGRAYPIRLEFKSAELTSSVKLMWKTPRGVEQVIPARNLRTSRGGEVMVVATQFPPDDSSAGFARGNSISKEWDMATTEAALSVADMVAAKINGLAGTNPDDAERLLKIKRYLGQLIGKAWSRSIAEPERAALVDRFFVEGVTPELATKRLVLATLKSPSFLFRELGQAAQGDARVATRLSYGLWDSLPDRQLMEAAEQGRLNTAEQVTAQAERMVSDPRTRAKLRHFVGKWLKLDSELELTKDATQAPQFTEAVVSDLRTSLEIFVEEVLAGPNSDFRDLLRADYLWLNRPLAEIYAPEFAALQGDKLTDQFVKVPCGGDRSGVLTHPYLMASLAYHANTSPIHRGIFVARNLLGRSIKAPPEAITPIAPELHAGLTTRERVNLQTSPAFCQSCHSMINSLGFSLEHYDLVGRLRAIEKEKPIDATGTYRDRAGKLVNFNGSRELATYLVESPEVQTALITQLFQHLVKQPPAAFGPQTLPELRARFVENNFSIRKLIVDIMRVSALRGIELKSEGQT